MKQYHKVLSIAGSDSGAGAGIQADLKTFSALECYGMTVLTAVTAQNTQGVHYVFALPAAMVKEQLRAIFTDMGADVIKIGMLLNREIIEVVFEQLMSISRIPVVLDPVMYAKGGALLLEQDAVSNLKKLFPFLLLITPNLMEASELLGYPIFYKEQMEKAALDLLEMGAQNVLLKGGHLNDGQGTDCFCSNDKRIYWIEKPSVLTKNTHGTGCTLSSAIAAFLANGEPLVEAIYKAKQFLHSALLAGAEYELGTGHGPLQPFFASWREASCVC